jgi:hypothetical protein
VEITITNDEIAGGVVVRARVQLSARETNKLFLAGDTLIQLPLDGALPDEGAPMPRVSIFLSELAGLRDGYVRAFADAASAQAYAASLRSQLTTALEGP